MYCPGHCTDTEGVGGAVGETAHCVAGGGGAAAADGDPTAVAAPTRFLLHLPPSDVTVAGVSPVEGHLAVARRGAEAYGLAGGSRQRRGRGAGGRAVPGAVHRPHLEAVGRPVAQAADDKTGLVRDVTVVVAVGHVRPTTPLRGAAHLIAVLVLAQCRSAPTVGRGAPVERHLAVPARSGERGRGRQRPGVVHAHTAGRFVTVTGVVRGDVGRHVQRHRRAVDVGRDGGRPHPARSVLGKGGGGSVAHRHVPHHEALHRLAEGECGGEGAARSGAAHVRADPYRRRRVVHLIGVGHPVW